jgi:surface antigen
MQDPIMNKLLRYGTLLVCLGLSAPALAQTYDDLPPPDDSANCRAVAGQAEIDGTMQQIIGRACLQPDGTWQMVQSPEGNVLWYPLAAYPYPDAWYWGPPLFIGVGASFFFVDHFHHFHHFDHFNHFHQMDHNHFGRPMGAGFHSGGMHGGQFSGGGMHGGQFPAGGMGGMHGGGSMGHR